jgi:predicted GIY-YIG superfamily endonuclease
MPGGIVGEHFCYVLRSGDGRHTYVGYTVDPVRRLRQHNGELAGGAWSTKRGGHSWSFAFVVHSEAFDHHKGLSFEWHLKHLVGAGGGRRRRGGWKGRTEGVLRGLPLRLACLRQAMTLPKFAGCVPSMVVYAAPDLVDDAWAAVADANDHVCVVDMEGTPWAPTLNAK